MGISIFCGNIRWGSAPNTEAPSSVLKTHSSSTFVSGETARNLDGQEKLMYCGTRLSVQSITQTTETHINGFIQMSQPLELAQGGKHHTPLTEALSPALETHSNRTWGMTHGQVCWRDSEKFGLRREIDVLRCTPVHSITQITETHINGFSIDESTDGTAPGGGKHHVCVPR